MDGPSKHHVDLISWAPGAHPYVIPGAGAAGLEDAEAGGAAQRFGHGIWSCWKALTPKVAFGEREKVKIEKQKGKENSAQWPAGKRGNRRSPEEHPLLGILHWCPNPNKFPIVTIYFSYIYLEHIYM